MTGKIAPHLYNETRLVMAGVKPLATIERSKDLDQWAMAHSMASVGSIALNTIPAELADCRDGEIVITLRSNAKLITEYFYLLENGVRDLGIKEYHRRLGKLFGYTNADIEAFISANVHCDCNKCTGNAGQPSRLTLTLNRRAKLARTQPTQPTEGYLP